MTKQVHIDVIETVPKKVLLGNCAIVNENGIRKYYDHIWNTFLNRVEQAKILTTGATYGICKNLQCNGSFEYWTAVESYPTTYSPTDLIPITLDPGLYGYHVGRPEASLAYMYSRYDHNFVTTTDYVLNWKQPFFEKYTPDWKLRSAITIFIPLLSSFNSIVKNLSATG